MAEVGVGVGGPAEGVFPEAKAFSGGSLSAPFQTRFGAIAFISLRRKQQRQGWQLLGWLQQEATYPALFFLESGSNLCGSTPLFPEGRPLFSDAGSNLYRRNLCYAKQTARLHSSPCSSGWKQFMPAQVSQQRPSAEPGPAQDRVGDGGCLAGCSRKQPTLPTVHRSISSVQEAINVAAALCFPEVAFYFPKLAAIYTGATIVLSRRPQGCTVAPFPRAGSNFCRCGSRGRGRRRRLSSSFQAWSGARPRQGWRPLDWLQQEAIHLALNSSKQEASYAAVALCFPMVALYFLKPAATFTDCNICYARQTTGMRSRPSSSGWKQIMQAPGRRRGWRSLGGRPPLVGIRLAAAGSKLARPYFLEAGCGTCSSCT